MDIKKEEEEPVSFDCLGQSDQFTMEEIEKVEELSDPWRHDNGYAEEVERNNKEVHQTERRYETRGQKLKHQIGFTKKISPEQREAMLDFMVANPDLAKNRLFGPLGGVTKMMKWKELAGILNSCQTGVTKTPEKWSRSWQDWRSDVKDKARVRHHVAVLGVKPSKAPLTPLEERLLKFIAEPAVSNVTGVIEPVEIVTENPDGRLEFQLKEEEGTAVMTSPSVVTPASPSVATPASPVIPPTAKSRMCELQQDGYEERALRASERMADAMGRIASAVEVLASSSHDTQQLVRTLAVSVKEALDRESQPEVEKICVGDAPNNLQEVNIVNSKIDAEKADTKKSEEDEELLIKTEEGVDEEEYFSAAKFGERNRG